MNVMKLDNLRRLNLSDDTGFMSSILNKDLLYKSGIFDGLKYPNTHGATINLNAVDSNCLTPNGTDNAIVIEHATVETIDNVSALVLDGTWQVKTSDTNLYSISGTTLTLFHDTGYYANQIAYFKAYAGTTLLFFIVFSAGKGIAVYDVLNGVGYDVAGTVSDSASWNTNKQSVYHYNVQFGFDLWQNDTDSLYVRIPLKSDGTSILTDGDALTGYTWVSKHTQNGNVLLPFEGTYKFDEVASLIASDVGNWAFTAGTANAISYTQIAHNIGANDSIFTRIGTSCADRILWYSTAQTGSNLSKIETYTAISPNKRYGFRRAKAVSNPATRIEYLYDSAGMTPAYMNFGTGFSYGTWETFVNEVQRPVMLETDGTVDYELSRLDFTKKVDGETASDISDTAYAGNAMIEFRKYKWVYQYEDATYEYFICSNIQWDANYKAYAFQNENTNVKDTFYWGAFTGIYSTNLRSIADQAVMVFQTRNVEVSRSTDNGAGYYTIYKSGWDYIGNLLTLISKSDNSQASFGSGRSKSTNITRIATGTLKALPQFIGYTDETSDVKVFGIEGFWGNVWEGMAGLILKGDTDDKIKVKLTPPYNFDAAGYTDTGIIPSGTSGGYIDTALVNAEMGFIPKTASGSGTTYYCDGLWFNNAQVDYALVGGNWGDGLCDGSRYVALSLLASHVGTGFASRISFLDPA